MELLYICSKILLISMPFSEESLSPISYVNILIPADFPHTDDDLWNTFNRLKWDTDLSSADLSITRSEKDSQISPQIQVMSLNTFEDEQGNSQIIEINKSF